MDLITFSTPVYINTQAAKYDDHQVIRQQLQLARNDLNLTCCSGSHVVGITFFDANIYIYIYILLVSCDTFPISSQSEQSKTILKTTVQFPLEGLVSDVREVVGI